MLPAGVSSSATTSAQVVSPATSYNPTAPSRSGRLRGLSYLRHYTQGSHSHHHSSAPAASAPAVAPAVVTNNSTSSFTTAAAASPPPQSPSLQRRTTSPLNNTGSNAWLPTVSGVNGLSRVASQAAAELSTPPVHATSSRENPPVRSIDEAISSPDRAAFTSVMTHSPTTAARAAPEPLPSIRFTPYVDMRSSRESLHFVPIERILLHKDERIKVGRYSDRDATNPAAPVGFKSKVVSRRHCEFWCDNGQWWVRDVKSSSGTFLNHIRLSGPGLESKAFALNDGDILQLGIDFKGGEEQIFRCVKIRVELNRAWQKALNKFNMSAHRRLQSLAKAKDSDAMSTNSSECAICLLSVAPCQSLFVAPCSHVWHYKCIRPLIEKEYPTFLCPNCRAVADLERDIEEDEIAEDMWEVVPPDVLNDADESGREQHLDVPASVPSGSNSSPQQSLLPEIAPSNSPLNPFIDPVDGSALDTTTTNTTSVSERPITPSRSNGAGSWRRRKDPVPSLDLSSEARREEGSESGSSRSSRSSVIRGNGHDIPDGPMTPMNDAGPFLLDGRDGRMSMLRIGPSVLSGHPPSHSPLSDTPSDPPTVP